MKKEDIKSIILIFIILLLIIAMSVLGIYVYYTVINIEKNEYGSLYKGNTMITPTDKKEKNESLVVEYEEGGLLNQLSPSNSSNTNTQSGGSNITTKNDEGYYYKQLNSYSKIIYNALNNNKENLKYGTYKINFKNEFDDLLSRENGSQLLQNYYQSAIETYMYDNPDVFYLDPTKIYINIKTIRKLFSTNYEVSIDSGKNANYFANGYTSREQVLEREKQVEEVVQSILSKIKGQNNYQKIKIIHNYLIDNIVYDTTVSKNDIYNIYGALVNKEAVCEGYAKAFKYLIGKSGIESVIISGDAIDSDGNSQNHAWNYVNLNGQWYAVDVTWDDPILIGGGNISDKHRYKYFMKGSRTMIIDHIESYAFIENGQEYKHPILSIYDYE